MIEDDVEVGVVIIIDCGMFGIIRIGEGIKIDN